MEAGGVAKVGMMASRVVYRYRMIGLAPGETRKPLARLGGFRRGSEIVGESRDDHGDTRDGYVRFFIYDGWVFSLLVVGPRPAAPLAGPSGRIKWPR